MARVGAIVDARVPRRQVRPSKANQLRRPQGLTAGLLTQGPFHKAPRRGALGPPPDRENIIRNAHVLVTESLAR
jgi:hypothetical protein